ncbi:MAG TPA: hypothetical protein VLG41_21230 [Hydrogenophaga sp.]|uniref:hypothetical protein n=1 Tax=Hydrogenophaga sp. TaxID=1904254 RepID=UPI002BAC0E01|nr:hypothetical protein [Hydrogenophaga sp.]HSX95462.1 hypothetical protein [Hydrogenophaga sp.]
MRSNLFAPVFDGRKMDVTSGMKGANTPDSSTDSPNRSPSGTRAANTFGSRPSKPFFTITSQATPPKPDSPRLGASREAQEKATRKAADDRANAIVERMQQWLDQGQTVEAIHLIDKALADITIDQPPRFQWRLLKALATAFMNSATSGDLTDCEGITQAIRALAQRGWWDPTRKPFLFLSPMHRQALLARCDGSVRIAVMGPDIERQLGGPAGMLNVCDIAVLLDHMDSLFQDAQEHQDRACLKRVLDWSRRLDSLARDSSSSNAPISHSIAAQALLPHRCAHLIRSCVAALSRVQTKTIHVNEKLTLKLHHDWLSGMWALKSHQPADDRGFDHTANAHADFISTIDGLLIDPEGPPWHVMEDCVTQACQAMDWNADGMPWLQWRLLMAGRDGPANERTRWLGPYLTAFEQELAHHPSDGQGSARDRLFDILVRLARSDWPSSSVQRVLDAILRARGWQPSASQRFSLGLSFAQRGEPQALADLLRQGCPEDQVSQTQRLKLLELCNPKDLIADAGPPWPRPALSLAARIELLRLASPLFPPEGSWLRLTYEERCSACEALRLQRETQQPRPPIGAARTPQQGSPQRSGLVRLGIATRRTPQDQHKLLSALFS